MTWILTIIGDSLEPGEGPAGLVVPVREWTHSHRKACDTVEQLACEEFQDTYPRHRVCDMTWRDVKGAE